MDWPKRSTTIPLGMLTEAVLPKTWLTAPYSVKFPFSCALANWYALNYLMMSRRSEIEGLMHPDQLRAYSLLYDWWTAAYQDPAISLTAILDIVSQSDDLERFSGIEKNRIKSAKWPSSSERKTTFLSILSHLELKSWPAEEALEIPSRSLQEGQYHHAMFELFEWEFQKLYGQIKSSASDSLTSSKRHQAIASAYCQQFATNLYACATSRWITAPEMVKSLESGPALGQCTWLPDLPHDRAKSMPRYLWDIKRRCTVISKDLNGFQPYTCVSHTWGRWRLGDEMATIPGVPWAVPTNRKFKVEDLPTILRRVPCKTPYIWIDLLCIPQDQSELAEKEIARQGDIFRSALHVVAWLNDITGFGALRPILSYVALQFLRFHPGSTKQHEQDGLVQRSLDAIAGQRSSFFVNNPYPDAEEFQEMAKGLQLSPWFDSLWTLQEVCLRPDMWLCDRNWEVLSADGKRAVPINGLVCLLSIFMYPNSSGSEAQDPPPVFAVGFHHSSENPRLFAFYEVLWWYNSTGLEALLDLSRVHVLALGDRRVCTGRRAEAIMSALGATGWFVPGGENDRDLILGKYPAKFIQELQRKIPGEFFGTIVRLSTGKTVTPGYPEVKREVSMSGSLLPFGRGDGWFSSNASFLSDTLVGHPSLSTWVVEPPDGHVRIGSACIISSSSSAHLYHTRERLHTIFMPHPDLWPEKDNEPEIEVEDLHQWVREQAYGVYMIATHHQDVIIHWPRDAADIRGRVLNIFGVVLKGNDTQSLTSVGFFQVSISTSSLRPQDREFVFTWKLPEAVEVNWMVI